MCTPNASAVHSSFHISFRKELWYADELEFKLIQICALKKWSQIFWVPKVYMLTEEMKSKNVKGINQHSQAYLYPAGTGINTEIIVLCLPLLDNIHVSSIASVLYCTRRATTLPLNSEENMLCIVIF